MGKIKVIQFELGKCYRHTTGSEMKIVGLARSTMYGTSLMAENAGRPQQKIQADADEKAGSPYSDFHHQEFSTVGDGPDHASNWVEISEEDWMKNFS